MGWMCEHWLWPYELHKLDEISDDFDAIGKADERLTDQSQSGRGCGGICVLWRRCLQATQISGINSDRICGIRFNIDGDNLVSVIGVYLPCLDQGLRNYSEHLIELERESEELGSVVVLGDFNAHLSVLGQNSNVQGVLLRTGACGQE
jgi:hypothetical protein